jgi:hypothetical protein
MPEEPPWEWVDGDRAGAVLFGVTYVYVLGVLLLFLFAFLLEILEMGGVVSGPAVPPWAASPLVLPPLIAAAGLVVFWPRLFAIVGRLGISPVGLRLVLPIRKVAVNWGAVRRVGVDWVTVETGRGYFRYKLTTNQAQRLNRFVQPH